MTMYRSNLLALLFFVLTSAHAQPDTVPLTAVVVTEAQIDTIYDTLEALGTLQADETVRITATVAELVTGVFFEDGQRVQQGDLLVELDSREEQAELAEQQSILAEARLQIDRLEQLVRDRAASVSELDIQKREANAAQARIDAIRARIDLRLIKAPFDGVVGLRNISIGALAQPQEIITTLVDDRRMKLDFQVPSLYRTSLKVGNQIQARSDAFPDQVFNGQITSINNLIDPSTRSVTVRSVLPNPDFDLQPGLLMQVLLQYNIRQAVVLPEETILVSGNTHTVLVVAGQDQPVVTRQVVQLGLRQAGRVEILSGIESGTHVISQGLTKVQPGDAVSIQTIQQPDESLNEVLQRIQAMVVSDDRITATH